MNLRMFQKFAGIGSSLSRGMPVRFNEGPRLWNWEEHTFFFSRDFNDIQIGLAKQWYTFSSHFRIGYQLESAASRNSSGGENNIW